jgi:hypothetical protein
MGPPHSYQLAGTERQSFAKGDMGRHVPRWLLCLILGNDCDKHYPSLKERASRPLRKLGSQSDVESPMIDDPFKQLDDPFKQQRLQWTTVPMSVSDR